MRVSYALYSDNPLILHRTHNIDNTWNVLDNVNSGRCICAVIGEVVIHDLKTAVQACVMMVFQTAILKLIHKKNLIVYIGL